MTNLYYIQDLAGNYFPFILDIICVISILFSISVITVKNPVISVLFLIGLFITIGGYLIIIGIGFIGLSYLLVYVGAVSILFLFILMLINIRVSELINETKNSIPLVFLITLLFGNISFLLLPQENTLQEGFFSWDTVNSAFTNTLNNWDNYLVALTHITSIGNVMYSVYAVWLILVSIILLLAMVGAIVINIKQKTLEINKKYSSSLSKDTIILQSKINFSLLKTKLIRIFIIGTIIWCIRLLLIKTIGFNSSIYLEFMILAGITGSIDFFLEYLIFGDNNLLQCASHPDQNWPENSRADNSEQSNSDNPSNVSPETIERLKAEYLEGVDFYNKVKNTDATLDSEGRKLPSVAEILFVLSQKEAELSAIGEDERNWLRETKGESDHRGDLNKLAEGVTSLGQETSNLQQAQARLQELTDQITALPDETYSSENSDSDSDSDSSDDNNSNSNDNNTGNS